MFNSCILRLYQFPGAVDSGTALRVEVKLFRPHALVSDNPVHVVDQWVSHQEWHFYGTWRMQPMYGQVNPGTVGVAGTPPDRCLWLLNVHRWELAFVAAGTLVGGGLKFGEEKQTLGDDKPACVLYDAGLTNRGIAPMKDTRPPRGTERMAGGFLEYDSVVLKRGYVFWTLNADYYP